MDLSIQPRHLQSGLLSLLLIEYIQIVVHSVKDPDIAAVTGLSSAVERSHIVANRMAGLCDAETEGIDLFMVVLPFSTDIDCYSGVESKEFDKSMQIQQGLVVLEGESYWKCRVSESWTGEHWEGVEDAVQGVLDGYLIERESSACTDYGPDGVGI
jgi:hypothetical protein